MKSLSSAAPARVYGLVVALLLGFASTVLADTYEVKLETGEDIPIERLRAPGSTLIIWTPSSFGVQPGQAKLAAAFAARGHEVWIADLHAAYFEPVGRGSVDIFRPLDIAHLVDTARNQGKTDIFLMSTADGARPVLQAARAWQLRHPDESAIRGLLLFQPSVYGTRPELGEEAEYLPVVTATNLPIFIIQPSRATTTVRLPRLQTALRRGGAVVFTKVLDDVVSGFQLRPEEDLGPKDIAAREALPDLIDQAIRILRNQPPVMHAAAGADAPLPTTDEVSVTGLKTFAEKPPAPALVLTDLAGRRHDLKDYRGKVVLLNFWASWCPPCVQELPSMQRLYEKLQGQAFEILAADISESPDTVRQFLARFNLTFPVLLDPTGQTTAAWKVYVFPSTYIIDTSGNIRYGSTGAMEWDGPEAMAIVRELLHKPGQDR
jgi:peroxiredoxin